MEDNKIIKPKLNLIIIIVSVLVISLIITLLVSKYDKSSTQNDHNTISNESYSNNENIIKVRYAYAYNIPTADSLNEIDDEDYIDILEFYIKGNQLAKINKLLEEITFEKADTSMYSDTNLAIGVAGTYEVTINNIVLLLDYESEWALYTNNDDSFIIKIPEEFVNEIAKIVQEKVSEKTIKFSSKKITISQPNNKDVIVTNEKHIKILTENLVFSKVNISEEDMTKENIAYTVDLNNGIKFYIYRASIIGYIVDKNGEDYYIAFMSDYEDIVNEIYKNYTSTRN